MSRLHTQQRPFHTTQKKNKLICLFFKLMIPSSSVRPEIRKKERLWRRHRGWRLSEHCAHNIHDDNIFWTTGKEIHPQARPPPPPPGHLPRCHKNGEPSGLPYPRSLLNPRSARVVAPLPRAPTPLLVVQRFDGFDEGHGLELNLRVLFTNGGQ